MDEFISLILHGIKLAKDLEPSLQNLPTQQEMISKLDEIIRIFITARERLSSQDPSLYSQMLFREVHQQIDDQSSQEYWLRNKMIELLQTQVAMGDQRSSSAAGRIELMGSSSGGGLAMELGSSRDVQQAAMASSSSQQRPRRRKDDAGKRTMKVAAPRMGNTEIPPEDGYTWRKYGQKEILGSKFPRSYYRCTHQKLYQCPAKKQFQRLDDDPHTFEVTYMGEHTCHMSSTAPSVPPPPQVTQHMAAAQPPSWLEFSLGGGSGGAGTSSGLEVSLGGGSSGGGAGPSGGRADQYPVVDMADVMFNSGSSSSNSMDLLFSSMEDRKWEAGDNKN